MRRRSWAEAARASRRRSTCRVASSTEGSGRGERGCRAGQPQPQPSPLTRLTSMISLKSVALDQFAEFTLGVGTEASPTNRSASLTDDAEEVYEPRSAGAGVNRACRSAPASHCSHESYAEGRRLRWGRNLRRHAHNIVDEGVEVALA